MKPLLLAWGAGAMVTAVVVCGVTFLVLRRAIDHHRAKRRALQQPDADC
jgi:nitrate reductase gamma subunit